MKCANSVCPGGPSKTRSPGSRVAFSSRDREANQPLFPSLTYPVNSSLRFFAERGPVPKPQGDHARAARLGSFRTQGWGLCTLCQPQPWPEAARSAGLSGQEGLSLQDGSEGRVQGPSHTHLPGSELEGEGRWKGESGLDYPRTGGGWETEALGVGM